MKKRTGERKTEPSIKRKTNAVEGGPRCGLCGKQGNLTRTECCGQWICDDESSYVLFSYERNSCHRNHRRFTLCSYHIMEGHEGDWQTCQECRKSFETEMYVWYGTNEHNFVKLKNPPLKNPPSYEPTHRGHVIRLGEDGYSRGREGILCEECTEKRHLGLSDL